MSYACYRSPCIWPSCGCTGSSRMHPTWQPLPAPTHPYQAYPTDPPPPRGCICPAGAEATCKGDYCPRQPTNSASSTILRRETDADRA